jgi:hypothetical protein
VVHPDLVPHRRVLGERLRLLKANPRLISRAGPDENEGPLDGEEMVDRDQGAERGLERALRGDGDGLPLRAEEETGDPALVGEERPVEALGKAGEPSQSGRGCHRRNVGR